MIKLLDDIRLIEKPSIEEPYLGCIFTATAMAFLDEPELMPVWVETDEHGETLSTLNIGTNEITVLCGKNKPSMELLIFLTSLAQNDEINKITCGKNALPVLKSIFGGSVAEYPLMKCTKSVNGDGKDLLAIREDNSSDLYEILAEHLGDEVKPNREMFMLKILRERLMHQSSVLTLEQDGKAVSTACIRGRTKSAGAIVSVITLPEYRCRGYASFLTAELTKMLVSENRTAWLSPENPSAEGIYRKIGFTEADKLYTITLNK